MFGETIRIIGINDIKFFYTEDMRTNRKNIICKSQQFEKIINYEKNKFQSNNKIKFDEQIQELFDLYKNKLTDLEYEIIGYF